MISYKITVCDKCNNVIDSEFGDFCCFCKTNRFTRDIRVTEEVEK
jgi:hypothetical protein